MSGWRLPAPLGHRIDRARAVRFVFDGQVVQGLHGDTVASALLAQGIMRVGRSAKLHRPRGVFSSGPEEPSALLQVGDGARRTPHTRATEVPARDGLVCRGSNGWPSLRFDLGAAPAALAALMPAGFYYKTFMWPHWRLFEPTIRRLAAGSRAPAGPDPDRYDEVSARVEVLVIGAGAAGIQAALSAARAGRQVALLESDVQPGGWLATQTLQPGSGALDRVRRWPGELAAAGIALHTRTTAVAIHDHALVTAVEQLDSTPDAQGPRERLWKIRAGVIVVATGALERPMIFPDNDRPGVMLAGAMERYATHYGVGCGRRVVIAAACDSAYGVARSLQLAGIEVAALVDARNRPSAHVEPPQGVEVLRDSVVVGVNGTRGVRRVTVASRSGHGLRHFDADAIASAGGHMPNLALHAQAGGSLRWLDEASMFVPARTPAGMAVVGAAAGAFDLQQALEHADAVGRMPPCDRMLLANASGAGPVPAYNGPTAAALSALGRRAGKTFVDLMGDVCAADVELAALEGYRSVEHLKRYTATGMSGDQGKTSNVNALVVMGQATLRSPPQVGTTRFRPPGTPVTLGTWAGGRTGSRARPVRPLPARGWHAEQGALFEEFGGWERPAAYPRPGESLQQAAEREAAQVRLGVGLFDASPLGKIEVHGPDAADFLDLMVVGTVSTLPVGGARYIALLNENGIVVDDGIVSRLGPNHFWVNTTSGGAERAALAFEEWLQCEFVHHRVFIVPVTSQWATVTVSGPEAWHLLSRLGLDTLLAPQTMRHMTMRESTLDGYPLRVLRASYNGELGYEVNLPPSKAPELLRRLWPAGRDLGICAYGVEALMIMRLEKGFLHVGADTDGTTLPQDVGLDRGIDRKKANFVGRRSLARPGGIDPDRLQLVGLQPVDRRTRLPVGAHLSLQPPPADAHGYVTSSAYSPALRQPIALAMLRRGRRRLGERLQAWHLGRSIEVEVVTTPFFDEAGLRMQG